MKAKRLKIFILIFFIGFILSYKYYPCFIIKFLSLSKQIGEKIDFKNRTILFLFGSLCAECPSGEILYSFRKRPEIVFIVPSDFSEYDIRNRRELFLLKGEIIYADNEIENCLKKFSNCLRIDDWKSNYIVKTKSNKKISEVMQF